MEVDRELRKLSMKGFLKSKLIRNFPYYKKREKENPSFSSPSGNMYRPNLESSEWQEYAERTQNHASSE